MSTSGGASVSAGVLNQRGISYKERTRRATKSGSHRYAFSHTHIPCDESRDPLQQRSVEAYLALIYPKY